MVANQIMRKMTRIAKMKKNKLVFTYAFQLMGKLFEYFGKEEKPRVLHATAEGFRAEVDYDGQQYEVIVNPLYKQAEVVR